MRKTNSSTTNKQTGSTAKKPKSTKTGQRRGLLRTLTDTVFAAFSTISVLLLWLCAASVYISPERLLIASVLGLAFPIALVGTLCIGVLSILFAPRVCWIAFIGLATTFGSIRSYCPINTFKEARTPSKEALRIMNYNTNNLSAITEEEEKRKFLMYLLDVAPDIIVFQEGNPKLEQWASLNERFERRFPHHATIDSTTNLQIWSRFDILRHETVTQDGQNAAVAFWLKNPHTTGEMIVINTHLKTNFLSKSNRESYKKIVEDSRQLQTPEEEAYRQGREIMGKVANSAATRAKMADDMADFIRRQPSGTPVIACGDFNDTPISYAIQRLKRLPMNDAFRMVGNGPAWSFTQDAIFVRIDHQFFTNHLQPLQANIDRTATWSDHYPLIVTYEWSEQPSE